jgi:glycosyltransferase involved in cell wall biosynthesis
VDVLHEGTSLVNLYEEFKDKLPIRYLALHENFHYLAEDTTRSPATTWNYGIRHSEGKFVIVTGADILLSSPNMIEKFLTQYKERRLAALTYFLSASMTNGLEIDAPIQSLGGFWEENINGNKNMNRTVAGHTTYLTGQPRDVWEWIGLFRTDLSHLVNDQDLVIRENFLGKNAETLDYVCYHQCHPTGEKQHNVVSPGWHYENEAQARLLEPAPRDAN